LLHQRSTAIGCALYCSIALTIGGVGPGLGCSSRPQLPAAGVQFATLLSSIVTRRGTRLADLLLPPKPKCLRLMPDVPAHVRSLAAGCELWEHAHRR
jgi:hypothetical protein